MYKQLQYGMRFVYNSTIADKLCNAYGTIAAVVASPKLPSIAV